MKINKILAAGIAATLAVTSLSAVVSAEKQSQEYDIYITQGKGSKTVSIQAEVNKDIAQHLQQNKMQAIVLTSLNDNFADADVKDITITVSGYQTANASAVTTKEFKFVKGTTDKTKTEYDPNTEGKWYIVVLDKKTPVYHDGELASFYFDTITSLKLDLKVEGTTLDSDIYSAWDTNTLLTIGSINIWDVNYATGKLENKDAWTVGKDYLGTTAEADKDEVIKRAAKEQRYTLIGAAAATNLLTGDADLGLEIGTPVANATALQQGDNVISTQVLYKTTKTGVDSYEKAADAAIPAGATLRVTTASAAVNGAIVVDGELKTTGYVTEVGDGTALKVFIYSADKITDSTLIGTKKLSEIKVSAATAAAFKTDTGYTAFTAAAKLPVIEKIDTEPYEKIVNDSTTADITDATGKPGAIKVIKTVRTKTDGTKEVTYSTTKDQVRGLSFTAYGYDTNADSVTPLLAYSFANGGWYTTKTVYGDKYSDGTQKYKLDRTTNKLDAWLPVTTIAGIGGRTATDYTGSTTITRYDVWELSETDAYWSTSGGKFNGGWIGDETSNQTYKEEMTKGTRPLGFAGLASQVANFFNKQNNGTITFNFKSAAAAGASSAWSSGIPSTEVGLIGSGAGQVTSNFALFFNYGNTGGMMLSKAKADLTKGSVEFDIADYLSDCGGLTKATLENIYYGLNVGYLDNVHWTGAYGMFVDKVILAYDDAPAADADAAAAADDDATVADDDDAAAVVDADDDDDDDDTALIEDDDDDDDDDATIIADDDDDDTDDDDIAAVITDDDEDDTAAAGTVDVVTPAAQDSNPATGVGLAVIPAIVAAAAMAISKKRK